MGTASEKREQYEGEIGQQARKSEGLYRSVKRGLDIIIALSAAIVLMLPMAVVALVILLIDGKPVIYSQYRLGKGGRLIRIYKFRSMHCDADRRIQELPAELRAQYAREFKIDVDPRVTKVGRFLRKTSIDELPQLWNILRGDLSFIGPRPILPEEIELYHAEDRDVLLSVLPGLTGYWQACSTPDDTYSSGRRQKMELHYARNVSLHFDLRIFLRTIVTVIRKAAS